MERNYLILPPVPRQRRQIADDDYDCPTGQNFYRCASGAYLGGCDHDPCDTGHCLAASAPTTSCEFDTLTVTLTDTVVQGNTYTSTLGPTTNAAGQIPKTSAVSFPSKSDGTAVTSTGERASFTSSRSIASTVTLSEVSKTTTKTTSTTRTSSSTSTPSHNSSLVAGATVGSAAGLVLILLLLFLCCLKRNRKFSFKYTRKSTEDKRAEEAVSEEARVLAEREKALRALENRGPGM